MQGNYHASVRRSNKTKASMKSRTLLAVQITEFFIACNLFTLEMVVIFVSSAESLKLGTGIWLSSFVLLSAFLGYFAKLRNKLSMIKSCRIMAINTSIAALAALLSFSYELFYNYGRSDPLNNTLAMNFQLAKNIICIFASVIIFVLSVLQAEQNKRLAQKHRQLAHQRTTPIDRKVHFSLALLQFISLLVVFSLELYAITINKDTKLTGTGIWFSLFIFVTALLGCLGASKNKKCLIGSCMVMAIVTCIISLQAIFLYCLELSLCGTSCTPLNGLFNTVKNGIGILISAFVFVLTIIQAVHCGMQVCGCYQPNSCDELRATGGEQQSIVQVHFIQLQSRQLADTARFHSYSSQDCEQIYFGMPPGYDEMSQPIPLTLENGGRNRDILPSYEEAVATITSVQI